MYMRYALIIPAIAALRANTEEQIRDFKIKRDAVLTDVLNDRDAINGLVKQEEDAESIDTEICASMEDNEECRELKSEITKVKKEIPEDKQKWCEAIRDSRIKRDQFTEDEFAQWCN